VPSWTTETLVARIKRKCQLPVNDGKLTDAEVLQIADEEVQARLLAAFLTVREDYFVDFRRIDVEANQRWIQLPSFVASSTMLDIGYIDPNDATERVRPMQRMYSWSAHYDAPQPSAQPAAYVIEGDRIGLVTPCQTACVLVIRYERRPSRMILAADYHSAEIASYNPTTLEFTLTGTNASIIANLAAGTTVDIARATPPLGIAVQGLEVVSVSDPVWTLTTGTVDHSEPETFAVTNSLVNAGDYLVVSGETPVFPLPDVWFPCAIYAAAATVCREIGDVDQAAMNDQQAAQLIAQAVQLQTSRVRKAAHVAVNFGSPLRASAWGGRRIGENQWGPF
jgi:hypothetical protein